MDDMVSTAKQIFVVMSPKAGGSSMKAFINSCMNTPNIRNWINDRDQAKQNLKRDFKIDKVISTHFNAETLIDLSKHTSRGTLITYLYREETDRLLSVIKQVTERLCSDVRQIQLDEELENRLHAVPRNETHCVLNEGAFVDIIEQREREIKDGPDDILRCGSYEAIEKNLPNFVFLHYKQGNQLQSLISKHYCPDQKSISINVTGKKPRNISIQLEKNEAEIHTISEWLAEKTSIIEWSLKMKGRRCQYKTRKIEDALFACEDEMYQISGKCCSKNLNLD